MSDLANLYIKIDSSGVVTASRDLDHLSGQSRKAESATASVTKGFNKLKAVVISLGVAYATLKMAQYVKDATILAARYETLGVVMNRVGNNAGYNSKQMEVFSRGLQKAGIAMVESRNTLTRMVQAQIDLTSSQKLARIAQDAAVIGDLNSSQAFEQMIYGLQTGHIRILKTIGLNVDFLKSEKELADALGKKRDELSDTEVMQARVNAVIKSGVLIQGVYKAAMGTAGKQMLSLQRHLDNLKVLFGAVFTPALAEIIGAITDGLVDLNGELSGDGKKAIEEWGNTFRLVIIQIEIEIQKLLMGFNRISIAYSSLGMLYGGPGSLIGMIPGLKGAANHFEYFADVMIEATDAFAEHEKSIASLEKKYRDLQEAMTPEGKAKAAATQKASEDKILALRKEIKETEKLQKAIEAANKAKLKVEIDTTDFVTAYNEIETIKRSAAETAAKIETVYGKNLADAYIDSVVTAYQNGIAAAEKASEDQLAVWGKYNEDYQILLLGETQFKFDEYARDLDVYLALEQAKTGITNEEVAKRKQLMLDALIVGVDVSELARIASYYKDLEGFEQTYHDKMIELIDAEAKARKDAGVEEVAIAKWVAKEKGRLEQELFEDKTKYIDEGFSALASTFSDIAGLYDEGSEAAERWEKASKAMEIAQKAVAVVNAVAAIANQGLGDPYTAFVRIAAMAAAMGALLASIGESVGGGGGGGASVAAKPASTVLGAEAGTESESISKAWELLEDTYDMEYRKLSGIHNEMKSLNKNIMGLVTNIARTGSAGLVGGGIGSTLGWKGEEAEEIQEFHLKWLYGEDNPLNKLDFVGNWLNDLVGDTLQSIVGGQSKTTQTGGGIELESISAGGLLGGDGISGYQYADMKKETEGGWFGSDKTEKWTETKSLPESTSDLLTHVYKGISKTLSELSKGLGTDLDEAMNYVFEAAKISLHGKTTEEINEALSAHFSAVGDTAVEALFGSMLSGYQQAGEGLMETAVRLIVDKEIILETLSKTNQMFWGSTQSIIAFSETLIEMAGGLDKLTEAVSVYYDKFFSDEEKQVRLQKQLTDTLLEMNLILPNTRAGYRDLVEGLNLQAEAGQKAYVTLLQLAEASDDYYSGLESSAELSNQRHLDDLNAANEKAASIAAEREGLQSQLDWLILSEIELRNQERNALDASNRSLYDQIKAQEDLNAAREKEIETVSGLLSAQEEVVSEYQGYVDKLKSVRESMKMEGSQESLSSVKISQVLEQVRAGDYSGIEDIDVSSATSTAGFATQQDYQRNFFKTLSALTELENLTGDQLSMEELSLTTLQSQLDVLQNIDKNTAISAEDYNYDNGNKHGPEIEYIAPASKHSSDKMLADNVILIEEVQALREEVKAGNLQMARNTGKTAKILTRFDDDGLPAERTA